MTTESRSPEDIERDIERERAGLTSALDDLQQKFSVESIANQVTSQFREHGGDIGRSVSDAVKRNPLALALTGVGLAWLIMGNKSGERDQLGDGRSRYNDDGYRDYEGPSGLAGGRSPRSSHTQGSGMGPNPGNAFDPHHTDRAANAQGIPAWARTNDDQDQGRNRVAASPSEGSQFKETARGAADKAREAASSVTNRAQDLASSASDQATAWKEQLAEGTESFSEGARNRVIAARESAVRARAAAASYARQGHARAMDLFEEQPLVAGALALAIGAAVGAALPRSRMEDGYIGEHSDRLIDEAERIFEEEKQKLVKVAKAASDEAKTVASETKKSADDAAPGETAGQTVVDEAKSSGKRIADAAEAEAKKQDVGNVKKP